MSRMTTTKTHITIAALACALGIAGSPLAQDADAAKNDGRFSQSGEAKKAKLCNSLQGSYSDLSLIRDVARETGDKKGFSQARRDAERVKRTAIERGCDWA
jgi:hypothetical protein